MLFGLGISRITPSYQAYESYDAMLAAVNSGEVDAIFPAGGGMYYSEENGIYQTGAVISLPSKLIYKGQYEDSAILSIAVNANNSMQYYYVRTLFPNAIVTEYPSIDDCLAAVMDGKAEATTLNGLRADAILRNARYASLSSRQLNRNDDRCFGVAIGNEGLLKLLNRGVSMMSSDYAMNISFSYTEQLRSASLWDDLGAFGFIAIAEAVVILILLLYAVGKKKTQPQPAAAPASAPSQEGDSAP